MSEWLLQMRHNHIKCMCGMSCLHVSLNATSNYLLCLTLYLITFFCPRLNIYFYMCFAHGGEFTMAAFERFYPTMCYHVGSKVTRLI